MPTTVACGTFRGYANVACVPFRFRLWDASDLKGRVMSFTAVVHSYQAYCPYCKAPFTAYNEGIALRKCDGCGKWLSSLDDLLTRSECSECGKMFLHNFKYRESSRQQLLSAKHTQSNCEKSSSQVTAPEAMDAVYSGSKLLCPRCLRRRVKNSSSSGCLAIVIMVLGICFSFFTVAHLV